MNRALILRGIKLSNRYLTTPTHLSFIRFWGLLLLIAGSNLFLQLVLPSLHLSVVWLACIDTLALSILTAPAIYRVVTLNRVVELQDSHLRIYQQLVDSTLQGVMITDEQMVISNVNGGFTRTTGYSEAEVVGKTPNILQSGKQSPEFYQAMWKSIRVTGQWEGEIWNRRKDGSTYAEWLNISAIYDEKGHVKNYVGVFSDITGHKLLEQRLRDENEKLTHISNTDVLTGIANRRYFDGLYKREWKRAQRMQGPLSVILIDIDCFKDFNDLFGHLEGDRVLRSVALVLQSNLKRPGDILARFGGEEFIALLPDTDAKGAHQIAEHLRRCVEALQIPHPVCVPLTMVSVSLGTATVVPSESLPVEALLQWADEALYTAKRFGRNQVVDYVTVEIE